MVIGDVNRELGESLVAELGADSAFVPLDVTDAESCRQAVSAGVERFGGSGRHPDRWSTCRRTGGIR